MFVDDKIEQLVAQLLWDFRWRAVFVLKDTLEEWECEEGPHIGFFRGILLWCYALASGDN